MKTLSELFLPQTISLTRVSSPWKTMLHDSLQANSSASVGGETFLQKNSILFDAHALNPVSDHWIFYLLFALLVVLALARYIYPEPFTNLLSFSARSKGVHQQDENKVASGLIVPFLLFLNFLAGVSLVAYVMMINSSVGLVGIVSFRLFLVIVLSVFGYYLLSQLFAIIIGFLFDTQKFALQHVQMGTQSTFYVGLLLNPLMLIYFYTQQELIIYLALSTLLVWWGIKLLQLVKIGLSVRKSRPYHIFLYLCTVEILPLMLLFRVGIETLSGI